MKEIKFTLKDQVGDKDLEAHVVVTKTGGVEIYVEGFGTSDMEPGHGAILYFENANGVPRCVTWPSIKSDQPNIQELDGTKESLRED